MCTLRPPLASPNQHHKHNTSPRFVTFGTCSKANVMGPNAVFCCFGGWDLPNCSLCWGRSERTPLFQNVAKQRMDFLKIPWFLAKCLRNKGDFLKGEGRGSLRNIPDKKCAFGCAIFACNALCRRKCVIIKTHCTSHLRQRVRTTCTLGHPKLILMSASDQIRHLMADANQVPTYTFIDPISTISYVRVTPYFAPGRVRVLVDNELTTNYSHKHYFACVNLRKFTITTVCFFCSQIYMEF